MEFDGIGYRLSSNVLKQHKYGTFNWIRNNKLTDFFLMIPFGECPHAIAAVQWLRVWRALFLAWFSCCLCPFVARLRFACYSRIIPQGVRVCLCSCVCSGRMMKAKMVFDLKRNLYRSIPIHQSRYFGPDKAFDNLMGMALFDCASERNRWE